MTALKTAHQRAGAVLATLGLAVAPVGGNLHLAAVQHEICAEHGELAHGEHTHAEVEADGASTIAEEPSHSDEHDHGCVLLASLWSQPLPAHHATITIAPQVPSADQTALAHLPRASRNVLAWAPKQSPPVAVAA